jgi:hypothetical protein
MIRANFASLRAFVKKMRAGRASNFQNESMGARSGDNLDQIERLSCQSSLHCGLLEAPVASLSLGTALLLR